MIQKRRQGYRLLLWSEKHNGWFQDAGTMSLTEAVYRQLWQEYIRGQVAKVERA